MSILEKCTFPVLEEKYSLALREIIQFVEKRFSPILGMIAAGSIMRGQGDQYSDIDFYLIIEGNYRQLIHKYFNGVPVQIFVNPPQRIEKYLADEPRRVDGGPSTAHMFATGFIVYDNDPCIEQYREQAKTILANEAQHSVGALEHLRYSAADLIENMLDVQDRDPDMAIILFNMALTHMLRYYFFKQKRYVPRVKDTMAVLRKENPQLAQLIHNTLIASGKERFKLALKIADMIIETRGLFEYEWEKEILD